MNAGRRLPLPVPPSPRPSGAVPRPSSFPPGRTTRRRWLALATAAPLPVLVLRAEDKGADLVDVTEVVPRIIVNLPYATRKNFTGRKLYEVERCFLRRPVAQSLAGAAGDLWRRHGYRLQIWDGYRPRSVQWKMWKAVPDPRFVGDPNQGSRHNRGAAVDVTLTDREGRELRMPTGYDEFTPEAHAYALLTSREGQEAMRNRQILQKAMRENGFQVMRTEWWHFDFVDWRRFGLLDISLTELDRRHPRRARD